MYRATQQQHKTSHFGCALSSTERTHASTTKPERL